MACSARCRPITTTRYRGRRRCSRPSARPYTCELADPPGDDNPTFCAANTSIDEARPEHQLEDQRIRDSCIAQLATGAAGAAEAPFFVECGLHKPHVPWIFPRAFLERFPSDLEAVALATDAFAPVGMPDAA